MAQKWAVAEHNFDGDGEGELSFKEGDRIKIVEEGAPDDWWMGELNGNNGFFPSNFCKIVSAPPPAPATQAAQPRPPPPPTRNHMAAQQVTTTNHNEGII